MTMIVRYQKNVNPGVSGNEKKSGESQTGADNNACRCKETSEMTPRELFKLMIHDLSFWKRAKKE
jgi:hypothetical protein